MISFIVPAHDEERLIGATLEALHRAGREAGEPYELVVVDDASTDRTAHLAREGGARVVGAACRQIAAARNAGARQAQGELFVFVDADTIVDAAVVRAAVRAVREGAVGGGAAVRFDGAVPLYARVLLQLLTVSFRATRLAAGCFLFCRREAFHAVGGFDEAYYAAEEIVMSRALGRQGRFVVLREPVLTSGRKLRTHSPGETLAVLARLAMRGTRAVKQREGLELWYSRRHEAPPGGGAKP